MKQVVVYTQDFCKYCEILKNRLNAEGIEFEARNISSNPTFKEEVIALGAMGMPFTKVGFDTFQGGLPETQEEILKAIRGE